MIESCCRYIYVNYKFLCFDLYTAGIYGHGDRIIDRRHREGLWTER